MLVGPMGRDVHRAIDRPIVEINGGVRWERIPEDAEVVGVEIENSWTIYPVNVLKKVLIVNDQVGHNPVAVISRRSSTPSGPSTCTTRSSTPGG